MVEGIGGGGGGGGGDENSDNSVGEGIKKINKHQTAKGKLSVRQCKSKSY